MHDCWDKSPVHRVKFNEIVERLQQLCMFDGVTCIDNRRATSRQSGGMSNVQELLRFSIVFISGAVPLTAHNLRMYNNQQTASEGKRSHSSQHTSSGNNNHHGRVGAFCSYITRMSIFH